MVTGRKAAAAACFITLLVLALGKPTLADGENCWDVTTNSIICLGFTCKFDCWSASKFVGAHVKVHRCLPSTFPTKCYCKLCRS
ncbi:hypothetical protein GUJ93_ZPchr0008g11953 [Zizania palustris]|uniref:Uncharacterized protein n=1 Tax=Zizania palustris TaxID=103762 RepID=A0A8J5RC75_ZIZPA|nr:hypothetical protein GUJ93_ZPchr0008g11953 [Zizania palustris]